MTNLEGRVLRRRAPLRPPAEVRGDLDVMHGLAVRLGQPADRFAVDPRAVFEELRRASAGGPADYSGISWERLDAGEALYWPCSPTRPAGTPRLFLDRFAHPDGRARFAAVRHRESAETAGGDFPLYATTGRILAHYQSGAQTRMIPELVAAAPEPVMEIHPDTAARSGIADGQLVRVSSERGSALARARTEPSARTDTVFLPFHFPGAGRANLVTGTALDPRSRMPEFKVSAVRVEPEPEPEAAGREPA